MANEKKDKKVKRPSAEKRNVQSKKRNLCNRVLKARVGSASNSLKAVLSQKDPSLAQNSLSQVHSLIDKGVKTGVFKINKASRLKARLNAMLKKI
jgi:small subunit ribosomal protein S20